MLELLYTSPRKTFAAWDSSKYLERFVFNKPWDCMVLAGGTSGANGAGGTFKIFKDGHVRQCEDSASAFFMLEMAGGGLCTFVKTGSSPYTYTFYDLDPFTAMPAFAPFAIITSTLNLARGWFIDRERALLLRPDGNYLRGYALANGTALLWSVNLGETFYAINYVADGQVMLSKTRSTGGTNQKVIFVDYREQVVLLLSQLNPYRVAVFDSHCGVVFAINASGYTEIYYSQPIPHHLTTPVLDPAAVGLYGGCLVTTQVMGDLNEPCPDRVVHWYLEEGIGALAQSASKSGNDGTASNYLFGPDDPGQVGLEETIRVEALI